LKWFLYGERPYWWALENASNFDLPPIKQFPNTCETGPGSPSGHAMVTSAIFFIIFDFVLLRKQMQKLRIPIWTTYLLMIVTVSISRLYISAHFPHQVVYGAVLGWVVANLVLRYHIKFEMANRSQYILTTLFLFGSAMATYFALNALGFDAGWSVKKAIKFCQHSEWVHLDNSPLFSLMRYTGFLLGFGLGLHSSFFKQIQRLHFTLRMKFTTALISIVITKLSELIVQPKSNVYMLYLFGFVMSSTLGFIYSGLAPYLSTKFASRLVYRKTSSIENC
jgi:glucose-6-phosphatase